MLMRDNQLYLVHYSLIGRKKFDTCMLTCTNSLVNLIPITGLIIKRHQGYWFLEKVAAKRQLKYKQIYRKIKINNLGPLQGGWGGLTEGVNIYAEGGSWIGQEGQ